jgi:HAD superfamily hydrolase (TIGR01509 family)
LEKGTLTDTEKDMFTSQPSKEKEKKPKQQVIHAVAFDMDGLLLNTEDLYEEVTKELLLRRGRTFREDVRRKMIGLPAPKAYQVLIESERLEETWQELHEDTERIFDAILETRLQTLQGVEETLQAVKNKGLPKCVATSSTRAFALRALEIVGVLDQLDFVVTAEEVPRGKPYPDIYLEAAKRMGVETQKMLVLEDSENGTKAGVSAGAYVISVPNRHTQEGEFQGAQWIAKSLKDDVIQSLLR